MKESKGIRIEVVLLALAIALTLALPGFAWAFSLLPTSLWGFAILGITCCYSFFLSILITNRILTGRFTNNGKLWFDD